MKTAEHSTLAIPLAMHLSPNYGTRRKINAVSAKLSYVRLWGIINVMMQNKK